MYESEIQIRVRYGETDKMGFVYYGFYSLYYEQGRTEALRKLGHSYAQMEEEGIIMPVVRLNAKYVLPASYDELLTIKTIIPERPHKKIVFKTEIYNEAGDLLHLGETTLVFMDKKTRKLLMIPDYIMESLNEYFS